MLIDTNAYLGFFAFRQLRNNTAPALLRLMDEKGIDRAAVSSASAITYRNAQSGNEELAEAVGPYRDRLIPVAVINPSYADWEEDLRICREQFGMNGIRIYPNWHNYALSDPVCHDLVEQATERRMVVSIPVRVEDHRQNSWLVNVPNLEWDEVVTLVRKFPRARFILLNGARYTNSLLGKADNGLPENYWIEISRLRATQADEIGQLLTLLGSERLVFGTGMPFKYPDPALVKLAVLDASSEVKEMIRSGNAARFLRGLR